MWLWALAAVPVVLAGLFLAEGSWYFWLARLVGESIRAHQG